MEMDNFMLGPSKYDPDWVMVVQCGIDLHPDAVRPGFEGDSDQMFPSALPAGPGTARTWPRPALPPPPAYSPLPLFASGVGGSKGVYEGGVRQVRVGVESHCSWLPM